MGININVKLKRLEACRKIRNIASQTCLHTFGQIIQSSHKVSEIKFRNMWLKELEKSYTKGYIDCWYDPPPDGVAVLFSKNDNFDRVIYPNLRQDTYWPKPDIYFQDDGFGYIFASPYTFIKGLPIIGDFGFSFYLGNSEKIKDHFKKSYGIYTDLMNKIQTGMSFMELYEIARRKIEKNGLVNYVVGITDKSGTDFGHTVPFVDRDLDEKETTAIDSGEADKINKTISEARIFINEFENYLISDNCAFTFEPRMTSPDHYLPIFSLHTIIQFIEGKKMIIGYFDGLINLLKMNWIKN